MSFNPPVGAATSSSRGLIRIAGDLGGTADSPSVPNMARANLGGQETVANVTAASSTTLNLTNGNVFYLTMSASVTTLTLSGATSGKACSMAIYIQQDATGGRSIAWPSNVKWASGASPTLSTAANALDIVVLESVDGGSNWYGSLVGTAFS